MSLLITPDSCGTPLENPPFHGHPQGPVDDRLCDRPVVPHPSGMTEPMPLADCIAELRDHLEQQRNADQQES